MPGIKATYKKYTLHFKRPGGTSRGVLTYKDSWFIFLSDKNHPERIGVGECSLIGGLSVDAVPGFEDRLKICCSLVEEKDRVDEDLLAGFPAIRFGLETACKDLASARERVLFPSSFTLGEGKIPINGLIWMGDMAFMKQQIVQKLEEGFTCLKLKIGALDFDSELELLKKIRKEYPADKIELRVDANGAFHPDEALEKLKLLSDLGLHSIEQPIRQGQQQEMARLCEETPLPIALDEELIGVEVPGEQGKLLDTIRPQYIILKPSLVGGLARSETWIRMAENRGIRWWVTSALESNIGLNAIAQWTYTLDNPMPQGLGTGQLYTNNIESPLFIDHGFLGYDPTFSWDVDFRVQ